LRPQKLEHQGQATFFFLRSIAQFLSYSGSKTHEVFVLPEKNCTICEATCFNGFEVVAVIGSARVTKTSKNMNREPCYSMELAHARMA
jgi:hypothetical protein